MVGVLLAIVGTLSITIVPAPSNPNMALRFLVESNHLLSFHCFITLLDSATNFFLFFCCNRPNRHTFVVF